MTQQDTRTQIEIARAIFSGITLDHHGYCGCPKCGSRNLTHDGSSLDDGYLSCNYCNYTISGNNGNEMIYRWNREHRSSFQLRLFFD